jgi:hypothetical protein
MASKDIHTWDIGVAEPVIMPVAHPILRENFFIVEQNSETITLKFEINGEEHVIKLTNVFAHFTAIQLLTILLCKKYQDADDRWIKLNFLNTWYRVEKKLEKERLEKDKERLESEIKKLG